ncbi:beta-microseminoprotein A1-like [Pseudorasbora parva]|uniref:beta-microseminoprotein A1-like n=1 Tax=Pseudorasbora parva TaxID=51549 RepID=UPI00351E29DA
MRTVVLGLFLCIVLPLVNAACFMKDHAKPVTFCQDQADKSWHPVGSSWRNRKCMDCSCSANSMSCCEAMARPMNYPDKCMVQYDYTTCTFEVFEKVPCVHGAVGK